MPAFEANYLPLSASKPEWGDVACLPWDEAIFGFPVAELRIPAEAPTRTDAPRLGVALEGFANTSGAEVVAVRCNALHTAWLDVLCVAGFMTVDLAQDASYTRPRLELPKPRFGVRPAEPEDTSDLCRIAGAAFQFGRYHTDPRFPRVLANRRYVCWVRNALESRDPDNHVFVLGSQSQRLGFFHAVLCDGVADLRLAATDPGLGVGLGLSLYSETLLALQAAGARRFVTKVSAANMGIVNLYASIGFRFSNPQYILHWHPPNARHLTGAIPLTAE